MHNSSVKNVKHHLPPNKNLRSMKNMLAIEERVAAGNNILSDIIRLICHVEMQLTFILSFEHVVLHEILIMIT